MLPTVEWKGDHVLIVDQRKLPVQEVYVQLKTAREVARAIERMVIRGAPAIGVAAAMGLALGLAFLASALAEMFGLAMIIGAFSIGLALSGTDLAHRLEEPLRGVYAALIPIFFVVMGMLVDVTALGGVGQFGIAATALAIIGKVVGCGIPSLFTGFNLAGAWRIGIGMLPRGEVALIMAGIGVGAGVIRQELFGVAIIVTVVTTVLAPLVLARSFQEGVPGLRSQEGA